jgi:uncharacterized protein (DUF342 family)
MDKEKLRRANKLEYQIDKIEDCLEVMKRNISILHDSDLAIREEFEDGLTIGGPLSKAVIPESIQDKIMKIVKKEAETKLKELKKEFENL